MTDSTTYTQGHAAPVISHHSWRTVENSASFVLPYLRQDTTLLDVGCGPASITLDFASRLPQGHVYGIDLGESVIREAKELAKQQGANNTTFVTGDIFDLKACGLDEIRFDIIHANQTLLHIPDRVGALRAMKNAVKPGGIIAIRDADFDTFLHSPLFPELHRSIEIMATSLEAGGAHPRGARDLVSVAMAAGFPRDKVKVSLSNWLYSKPEERHMWANSMTERFLHTDLRHRAIDICGATEQELEDIVKAWQRWIECEDAIWMFAHVEILCFA